MKEPWPQPPATPAPHPGGWLPASTSCAPKGCCPRREVLWSVVRKASRMKRAGISWRRYYGSGEPNSGETTAQERRWTDHPGSSPSRVTGEPRGLLGPRWGGGRAHRGWGCLASLALPCVPLLAPSCLLQSHPFPFIMSPSSVAKFVDHYTSTLAGLIVAIGPERIREMRVAPTAW